MKKYTTEDFIEKAKKIHGDKYDYSKTEYTHSKEKVIITCPIHGDFSIRANHHLGGIGCHKCAKENADRRHSLNTDEFTKRANEIHGNRYDYSQVEYVNLNKKVKIGCPIHGYFLQKPADHLYGCNCPKCALIESSKKRKKQTKDFIEKAKKIHGNKYDYSLVEYTGCNDKVKIICPKHGIFEQSAVGHIFNAEGCPICGRISCKEKRKNSLYSFIERANKVHLNKYDYSLVEYKNCYSKVKIICPKHGIFEQIPKNHLNGAGCPKCGVSKIESKTMSFLSENNIDYIYEKRFPKWLGYMSLDFYLPKYKIAIECQGAQHFIPVSFNKKSKEYNEIRLQKQIERDKIKKESCEKNGISLYYINYNENILKQLKKILYICKKKDFEN